MKVLIDSSVYISAFSPQEEYFAASNNFLEQIRTSEFLSASEIVLPHLVYFEVLNALSRHEATDALLKEVAAFLLEAARGNLQEIGPYLNQLFFQFRKHLSLKTSDVIIILKAIEQEALVVTWDKKLLHEGRKLIDVSTPKEFLM